MFQDWYCLSISPLVYHQSSSQCFRTDIVYLLVPGCIISPVVNVSGLILFIKYIYHCNLQFLYNIIIIVIDLKYHWTIWLQIYGTIPWTNKKVIFITHVHGLWLTLDVCCIYIFNWQSTLHFHSEFLYFLQSSQNLQPCHLSLWFQKEELLNAVKYMWKGK